MGEQEHTNEYEPIPPYRRYYNDLHYKHDAFDQAMAMQNLTQAMTGYEINTDAIQLVAGTDDNKLDEGKLLTFPITVLGPFLEQTSDHKMYDNYLMAFQCLNWFVADHQKAGCDKLKNRHEPCQIDETCALKDVADFCLDPILHTDFTNDIEYIDHTGRYDALSTRLSALYDSRLFGIAELREMISEYQWKFAEFHNSLPEQTDPEDL